MIPVDEELRLPADLAARYEIGESLGAGAQGKTFRATDRETNRSVVIKALEILKLTDWKELELFDREASVLRSLDHPAVPSYVDTYRQGLDLDGNESEEPDALAGFLVQELVEGRDLGALLSETEPAPLMSEPDVLRFLDEMLGVLEYLHGLKPPVVHRDIKPSNILRRPDGSYALVDFGAVQAVSRLTAGSTFVGTRGYMPVEQLMGRAEPRSDLYALGATALHLVSGIHPSDLTLEGLEIDFDRVVELRPVLRFVLRKLLAPSPEDRFRTATQARDALDEQALVGAATALVPFSVPKLPSGTRLEVATSARGVQVRLPNKSARSFFVSAIFFGGVLYFVPFSYAFIVLSMFFLGFLSVGLYRTVPRRYLEISDDRLVRRLTVLGRDFDTTVTLAELQDCVSQRTMTTDSIIVRGGDTETLVAETLTRTESRWITNLIRTAAGWPEVS